MQSETRFKVLAFDQDQQTPGGKEEIVAREIHDYQEAQHQVSQHTDQSTVIELSRIQEDSSKTSTNI